MKSIIKNNTNESVTFNTLINMQSTMMYECLRNGLKLSSTISKENGIWSFNYGISFYNDTRIIFSGQAQGPLDPHYTHVIELIRGEMTSELFPPVTPPKMVSYWKRHLITDIDVTDTKYAEHHPNPAVKSMWVGFTEKGVEVVRVADGTHNPKVGTAARIEYTLVPTRGICVFVVLNDYIEPSKTEKVIHEIAGTTGTSYTTQPTADSVNRIKK